ncbi:MAG: 1-(5-phosphoribosyl)-5-[(5-phosphoribosylamino)methylideneamino]imidazole-4-carboxamide isomerase [Candidatus Margulisiibacteriota bacterium]
MYNGIFEVIPAIDILGGQCVRLYQGDYQQSKVYDNDPAAIALQWQEQGSHRLHIVDLDGAKAGTPVNMKIISDIVNKVDIPIELGGGIRTLDSVKQYLSLGVDRVILGSVAIKDPELLTDILALSNPDQIIVGVDIKDNKPAIHGWLETSDIDLFSFLQNLTQLGVSRIILTDISKDGAMKGPNIGLMKDVCENINIPVIASGGVTNAKDILRLSGINGVEGCIIGKALYEGTIKLEEVDFMEHRK